MKHAKPFSTEPKHPHFPVISYPELFSLNSATTNPEQSNLDLFAQKSIVHLISFIILTIISRLYDSEALYWMKYIIRLVVSFT